ncbi:MAG TPA: nodulation protein NfeD [Anaeromyxobacteraceae bacterium]|nr:nodulation protein NfeD [Anaeromyxobacteraceae bacterium]
MGDAGRWRRGVGFAGLFAAALGGALALAGPSSDVGGGAPPRVLVLEIHGPITNGTAEYVAGGVARARAERFDALAIGLDTPGGALDATREIARSLLGSEVPVVAWVGPAGAHAGSAGLFVTLAADVAAMHPTSNIGAAHPVTLGGGDVEKEGGKDLARKAENDTAAFARTLAQAHGRNADWAEKAVRESVSATAEEAVRLRVVDFTAASLPAALDAADGRQVLVAGEGRRLRTRDAVLVPHEATVRQRLLSFLADPNVAAILMLVGTLGIAIELYHPGLVFPGLTGVLSLLLAFLAMKVIPVNVGAVLLILVGAGLLVAEAYVTTHGLAGAGGAACIVLGLLFFVDRSSSEYRFDPGALAVSPWIVWPVPITLALLLGFVAWRVAAVRRRPMLLGAPAIVGERGRALSAVGPETGEVFVHGEYWQARSAAPIAAGADVRVRALKGLVLDVESDPRAEG